MRAYKVVISPEAQRQMGNCVLFLAQKDLDAAAALKDRLVTEISGLCEMPGRYPFLSEAYLPANRYHKMFVEKYYLMLYQIRDETVYVDFVVDCRQDYKWLLRP